LEHQHMRKIKDSDEPWTESDFLPFPDWSDSRLQGDFCPLDVIVTDRDYDLA